MTFWIFFSQLLNNLCWNWFGFHGQIRFLEFTSLFRPQVPQGSCLWCQTSWYNSLFVRDYYIDVMILIPRIDLHKLMYLLRKMSIKNTKSFSVTCNASGKPSTFICRLSVVFKDILHYSFLIMLAIYNKSS